jgi:hypothetical protein
MLRVNRFAQRSSTEQQLDAYPVLDVFELYRAGLVEGASVMLEIPGIGRRRLERGDGKINFEGNYSPVSAYS